MELEWLKQLLVDERRPGDGYEQVEEVGAEVFQQWLAVVGQGEGYRQVIAHSIFVEDERSVLGSHLN